MKMILKQMKKKLLAKKGKGEREREKYIKRIFRPLGKCYSNKLRKSC